MLSYQWILLIPLGSKAHSTSACSSRPPKQLKMDELPGPSQSTSNEAELSMQHIGRGMCTPSYSTLPDHKLLPDISKIIIDSERIGPSHTQMGQPLCQICFGLDEEAFKDQINYFMQWSLFIESSKPAVEQQCKSCSLLRGSISQFEPLENSFEIPRSQVLFRESHGSGKDERFSYC